MIHGLGLGRRDIFIMGLLAGWWIFVLDERAHGFGFVPFCIFFGAGALLRLSIYGVGYWPPLASWVGCCWALDHPRI